MRDDDQSVRAAARRGWVVVTRNELGDGSSELIAERRAIGRRSETDLGIDCERREPLVRFLRAPHQLADFADDSRGQRNEVAGRQTIGAPAGVGRNRPERAGRDDVRGSGRDQQPLGQPAPLPLLGDADETVIFERTEVIVELLPRNSQSCRQRGSGGRLTQFAEQPAFDRIQRGGRRGGIVDHFDVEHGAIQTLTNFFVKPHAADFGGTRGTRGTRGT
jgi:hypothetical protein